MFVYLNGDLSATNLARSPLNSQPLQMGSTGFGVTQLGSTFAFCLLLCAQSARNALYIIAMSLHYGHNILHIPRQTQPTHAHTHLGTHYAREWERESGRRTQQKQSQSVPSRRHSVSAEAFHKTFARVRGGAQNAILIAQQFRSRAQFYIGLERVLWPPPHMTHVTQFCRQPQDKQLRESRKESEWESERARAGERGVALQFFNIIERANFLIKSVHKIWEQCEMK